MLDRVTCVQNQSSESTPSKKPCYKYLENSSNKCQTKTILIYTIPLAQGLRVLVFFQCFIDAKWASNSCSVWNGSNITHRLQYRGVSFYTASLCLSSDTCSRIFSVEVALQPKTNTVNLERGPYWRSLRGSWCIYDTLTCIVGLVMVPEDANTEGQVFLVRENRSVDFPPSFSWSVPKDRAQLFLRSLWKVRKKDGNQCFAGGSVFIVAPGIHMKNQYTSSDKVCQKKLWSV